MKDLRQLITSCELWNDPNLIRTPAVKQSLLSSMNTPDDGIGMGKYSGCDPMSIEHVPMGAVVDYCRETLMTSHKLLRLSPYWVDVTVTLREEVDATIMETRFLCTVTVAPTVAAHTRIGGYDSESPNYGARPVFAEANYLSLATDYMNMDGGAYKEIAIQLLSKCCSVLATSLLFIAAQYHEDTEHYVHTVKLEEGSSSIGGSTYLVNMPDETRRIVHYD